MTASLSSSKCMSDGRGGKNRGDEGKVGGMEEMRGRWEGWRR